MTESGDPTRVQPKTAPEDESTPLVEAVQSLHTRGEEDAPSNAQEEEVSFITLFQLPGIGKLSTKRLNSIHYMLRNKLKETNAADADVAVCAETVGRLFTEGDTEANVSRILAEGRAKITVTRGSDWLKATLTPLSNTLNCFVVVIDWLLGRTEKAETNAQSNAEKFPDSVMAMSNQYHVLSRNGKMEAAKDVLNAMTSMKQSSRLAYEAIVAEETAELGRCCTELGPEFNQMAIEILDRVVESHPDWHHYRFLLAKYIHRSIYDQIRWLRADMNVSDCLLRTLNLLLEVLEAGKAQPENPNMISSAYAEIGNILNNWMSNHGNFDLTAVLHQRAHEKGVDVQQCFKEVLQMANPDPSDLAQAGKYYRRNNELENSYTVLTRALRGRDSVMAHHQLALTLKAMKKEERRRSASARGRGLGRGRGRGGGRGSAGVSQAGPADLGIIPRANTFKFPNRPDARIKTLERCMKCHMFRSMSYQDEHVDEVIEHLKKALDISNDENSELCYDLGLVFKDLGEYDDAMEYFIKILDRYPKDVVRTFEQCGLVFFEQCKNTSDREDFPKKGIEMFNMTILYQARLVQQRRSQMQSQLVLEPWLSLDSLRICLKTSHPSEDAKLKTDDETELWLLRLLWVYAETLPVLVSLLENDWSAAKWKSEVLDKINHHEYGHAAVLDSLLGLVNGGGQDDRRSLMAQAYVRWARVKMLQDIIQGKSLGSRTPNRCVAHKLFCWVFSEAYPGTDPPSAWDESRPGSLCHTDQNAASVVAYDVAIVYEPLRDPDRIAARGLHQVLQDVCGLETWYMDQDDVTLLEKRKKLEKAVDDATLVVFICSSNDVSPEYESCVRKVITSDRYHVQCVTMDDTADLPAPWQGRFPTVAWTSDLAVQAAARNLTTETHLDSVCRLFCSLANVPMTQF